MAWSVFAGAFVHTTTTVTVSPNASHAAGDVEFLLCESPNGNAVTLGGSTTFAAVTGSPVDTGGTAANGACRWTMFWRRWNGTEGDPTISATNHVDGVIVSIRGGTASGDPWDVTPATSVDVQDTSVSCPTVTTVTDGCLIVACLSQGLPDAANSNTEFSAWTNANLTNITERVDEFTLDGNGGGVGLTTGEQAAAGATGATTATAATSSLRVAATIALRPLIPAGGILLPKLPFIPQGRNL